MATTLLQHLPFFRLVKALSGAFTLSAWDIPVPSVLPYPNTLGKREPSELNDNAVFFLENKGENEMAMVLIENCQFKPFLPHKIDKIRRKRRKSRHLKPDQVRS